MLLKRKINPFTNQSNDQTSIYLVLINLESCFPQRFQHYVFELFQRYLSVPVFVHHLHVWFYVFFCWLVRLPHLLVRLLQNEWHLLFCQVSRSVLVESFKQPSYHIQSLLGHCSQILSSWNLHVAILLNCLPLQVLWTWFCSCGCCCDCSTGLWREPLLQIRRTEPLSAQIFHCQVFKICYSYFLVFVEIHHFMHWVRFLHGWGVR